MRFSVIIPTFNREASLRRCLAALDAQDYPADDFEIVVADDGSDAGTAGLLAGRVNSGEGRFHVVRLEHAGPAAARNAGIKAAAGELLLFIGDDIIASPGLLSGHAAAHAVHPEPSCAILGYTTWWPGIRVTPFMRWLETGGLQFAYGRLADGEEADPGGYFYTSNLSVKKMFLLENGVFDEDFRYAAYEDVELGWRLKSRGLRLYYRAGCSAWHDHPTSLDEACARMVKVGEAGELLKIKTGRAVAPPGKVSPLLRVLRELKFAVYYLLGRGFEHVFGNAGVFSYLMFCCRMKGAEIFWAGRRSSSEGGHA